jgi:iron(III) transport system ATP-binding protein
MTKPAILHLEGITRQFSNTTIAAVADITLMLYQGDILSLLGPSGCGKTTLLRLIAGFEHPQAGSITLAGRTVAGLGTWIPPEKRDVGMVFQDYALFPHLTVAGNIAFGLQHLSHKAGLKRVVADRVAEAIALIGLQGMENRYPHELSGGQQQRVALARALAPRPTLILLDEPLSNLDVQVRLYLRQEVRDILKVTGTSAIFVTHDQEEALAISDQVAVMRQGRIEQLGTPEEIHREPASRFIAEFVTQANFIPAQQQGGLWQTEIGHFLVEPIHCTCKANWEVCLTESSSGELMIRQEDLILEPDPDGMVVVRDRQFLGREYCYRLQTPSGQKLQAHTPISIQLPIGERVRLLVDNQALRFFPKLSHL